ncbi:MAG: hypothetical protein J1F05_06415 [Muribaculaceae bacterium]|nr:hypothetical protein [Muribaculaceae bacterium]
MKPLWIKILIIAVSLPVVAFPALLSRCPDSNEAIMLLRFYPLYVVAAAICAFLCWPKRKEVTIILLVLMALTHAAMWVLVGY